MNRKNDERVIFILSFHHFRASLKLGLDKAVLQSMHGQHQQASGSGVSSITITLTGTGTLPVPV